MILLILPQPALLHCHDRVPVERKRNLPQMLLRDVRESEELLSPARKWTGLEMEQEERRAERRGRGQVGLRIDERKDNIIIWRNGER